MDSYKSDKVVIGHNIDLIYSKLCNPGIFKKHADDHLGHMPDNAREFIESVRFDDEGIIIDSPMGEVKLSVSDCVEPSLVNYVAKDSPVPFALSVNLEAINEAQTNAIAEIKMELPFIVRSVIGGKLSDVAQKLGEVLAKLPYGDL